MGPKNYSGGSKSELGIPNANPIPNVLKFHLWKVWICNGQFHRCLYSIDADHSKSKQNQVMAWIPGTSEAWLSKLNTGLVCLSDPLYKWITDIQVIQIPSPFLHFYFSTVRVPKISGSEYRGDQNNGLVTRLLGPFEYWTSKFQQSDVFISRIIRSA